MDFKIMAFATKWPKGCKPWWGFVEYNEINQYLDS
jgi:hypothetical protein